MRRAEIVDAARAWIGTPYRHQAATLGAGCDCLGLVRGVWRQLFGEAPPAMPNYRADWRDGRRAGELLAAAERHLVRVGEGPMAARCCCSGSADRACHVIAVSLFRRTASSMHRKDLA